MECGPRVHELEFAFEPASTRAAHQDISMNHENTRSVLEMETIWSMNNYPCRFCGLAFHGTPFNPRLLVEIHAQTSTPFQPSIGDDEDDDDDDDDDGMDAETTNVSNGFQLSNVQMLFSQPLHCCSAQCWMAYSLANHGELSPIGGILLRCFPSLSPHTIGGDHLVKYQQKSESTRQEIYARAAAHQAIYQHINT